MSKPLRLAIAGLGTVGVGVIKIIQQHADLIESRAGRPITITAINARTRDKDRGVDVSAYQWMDGAAEFANMDDVDVVVELVGGSDGLAFDLAKKSLGNGKHFVTANKALMAHHGYELAALAEENGVSLS
jgi:homoserine dehydrogenase